MKKLLRIIFLILLIHYAFGACTFESDACTGESSDPTKKICILNSEKSGCEEVDLTCDLKKGDGLQESDCNGLPVYNDQKEKLEYYTCAPTSDATGCEGKELTCPVGGEPGEGKVCSGYSASENKACIEDQDNKGICKEEDLCNSIPKDTSGTKTIDCSIYPVTNSETHTCVENTKDDNLACMEQEK